MPDDFRNPALWPLLLLAVLPIVLHLLDRRRARLVEWPAMRFLLGDNRRRLRILRLRELLLIATRCLVLGAFVWALLGPVRSVRIAWSEDPSLRRGLTLVIDTTQSMALRHIDGTGTSLDRARSIARRLTARLGDGDALSVLLSDAVDAPVDALPFERSTQEKLLDGMRPSGSELEWDALLDRSVTLAARQPTAQRDIVVLSDLPADSLARLESDTRVRLRERTARLDPTPRVLFVDCGDPRAANDYVRELATDADVVAVGEPLPLYVEISLHASTEPADQRTEAPRTLRWSLDDSTFEVLDIVDACDEESATHARSERRRFVSSVEPSVRTPGLHRVRASLDPRPDRDGLPADDERSVDILAAARIEVEIVEPLDSDGALSRNRSTPSGADKSAADWIETALSSPIASQGAPGIFRPLRTRAISSRTALERPVIVLVDAVELTSAMTARLESHFEEGGGLFFVPGTATAEKAKPGRSLLPLQLGAVETCPEGEPWRVGGITPDSRALAPFAATVERGLGQVPFRRRRPPLALRAGTLRAGTLRAGALPLARFEDGTPWLIESKRGAGSIVLATTPLDTDATDLPLTPLFLPILERLLARLATPALLAAATDDPSASVGPHPPAVHEIESRTRSAPPDARRRLAEELGARVETVLPPDTLAGRPARVLRDDWPWAVAVALAALLLESLLLATAGRQRFEPSTRLSGPRSESPTLENRGDA